MIRALIHHFLLFSKGVAVPPGIYPKIDIANHQVKRIRRLKHPREKWVFML